MSSDDSKIFVYYSLTFNEESNECRDIFVLIFFDSAYDSCRPVFKSGVTVSLRTLKREMAVLAITNLFGFRMGLNFNNVVDQVFPLQGSWDILIWR